MSSSISLHTAERSYQVFRKSASYYARTAANTSPSTQTLIRSPRAPSPVPSPSSYLPPTNLPSAIKSRNAHSDMITMQPISLGNSSVGHLMTEISRSGPGMENARRVVGWMMGVPVLIGMGIVGWSLLGLGGERGRSVWGYESGIGKGRRMSNVGIGRGFGEMKGLFGTGAGGGCKGGE